MVIGGILQSLEYARDSKEREIRLTHILKLSKKDFIKIFSSHKEAKILQFHTTDSIIILE